MVGGAGASKLGVTLAAAMAPYELEVTRALFPREATPIKTNPHTKVVRRILQSLLRHRNDQEQKDDVLWAAEQVEDDRFSEECSKEVLEATRANRSSSVNSPGNSSPNDLWRCCFNFLHFE